jgi:hypothetical protein
MLSDLIRKGSTMIVSEPHVRWDDGKGCAIGMAEIALGLPRFERLCFGYNERHAANIECQPGFEWLQTKYFLKTPCGCLSHSSTPALNIIAHIFNMHVHGDHSWTLDQLIEWVRSVEPSETAEPVEEDVFAYA